MRNISRGWRVAVAAMAGILTVGGTAQADGPRRPASPTPAGDRVAVRARVARTSQVHVDPRTNATFSTGLTSEGAVELVAETSGARLRKTVYPDGRIVLEIGKEKQPVVIAASAESIEVTAGRRRITVDPRTGRDEDFDQVRALLAGSSAVKALRTFTAALESAGEESDTDVVLATLTGSALVSLLDGDAGALGRVAKRLARKHNKRLRNVRVAACYPEYETQVWSAWQDLWACYDSVSIFWRRGCEYRWFLWIESAWFTFIRCSAFSL